MNIPPCILIVDDQPDNVELLEQILEDEEYDALTAYDGQEALDIVKEEMPDLILLDIMMPDMDGFEVCSILKSDEKTREIPIIFVTARTETVDKVKGLELGAVDYITKPFEETEVLARVRTQIRLKTMYEQNLKYHQALLHSQRVTLTDTLAKGMLHNINNLMVGIVGYVQLLKMEMSSEGKSVEKVNKILQATQNVNEFVQKFSSLMHNEKVLAVPVKINYLIEEVVGLFSKSVPREIKIETELSTDLFEINATPFQIPQVLLNIFTNAQEAMPDGGTLSIQTSVKPLPKELTISVEGDVAEEYLVISISDTGIGMDEETKRQIFDPLFTTKETVGVGLGLSAAYSIINNHKGVIDIQSEVGVGTTVLIYLPIT